MKSSLLLWIYLVLVILLGCTIGMALLPLGVVIKPLAGLLVAGVKGGLIVLFFMQLRYHHAGCPRQLEAAPGLTRSAPDSLETTSPLGSGVFLRPG